MLNSEPRLVLITARPLLGLHAVQHGVARDAGIVDQHLDRADFGFDLLDAFGAGLEGRHVPFEHRNAGFGLEFLRRLVIAAVIGGDLVAGGLQRLADGSSNATGSARDQRNASHDAVPSQNLLLVTGSLKTCMPDTRPGMTPSGCGATNQVSTARRAFPGCVSATARRTWRCPCRRRCTSVARPFLALRFCIS